MLFTNDGGGIKEASLLKHFVYSPSVAEEKGLEISPQIVLNSEIKNPIGALSVGRNVFKGQKYQIVDQTEDKIILKTVTPEKLEVTKTFLLTKRNELGGGHIVKMNLGVKYAADAGNMNLNDLYAGLPTTNTNTNGPNNPNNLTYSYQANPFVRRNTRLGTPPIS